MSEAPDIGCKKSAILTWPQRFKWNAVSWITYFPILKFIFSFSWLGEFLVRTQIWYDIKGAT